MPRIVLLIFLYIAGFSMRAQYVEFTFPAQITDTSVVAIESILHESGILPIDFYLYKFTELHSKEGQHIHFKVAYQNKIFVDSRLVLHWYPTKHVVYLNGNLVPKSDRIIQNDSDSYWLSSENTLLSVTPDTVLNMLHYRHGNQIVLTRDRASYYKDTTIIYTLFQPDAVSASGADYGVVIKDSNDAELPAFATLYTNSKVPLQVDNDSIYLQNKYVYITDISGRKKSMNRIPQGRMLIGRSDSLFECLQVLYHIYQFRSYIDTLGFTALHPNPIPVDPHGTASDQSSYIPDYLTFGDGGVDDAEDAEVIIHEYGHALIESASPGTNIGFERKAADEASCDYWATGYTAAISSFKPYWVFPWDGHNEFWKGRIINSTAIYPSGIVNNSIHQTGQMWSSTMLQISDIIGRRAMDQLLLESYYTFAANLSFAQMAQLLVKTDSVLYGGQHHYILCHLLTQRGFLNGGCYNGLANQEKLKPLIYAQGKYIVMNQLPEDHYMFSVYDSQGKLIQMNRFNGTAFKTFADIAPGIYTIALEGFGGNVYRNRILIIE